MKEKKKAPAPGVHCPKSSGRQRKEPLGKRLVAPVYASSVAAPPAILGP
jgi:hypothetical protein